MMLDICVHDKNQLNALKDLPYINRVYFDPAFFDSASEDDLPKDRENYLCSPYILKDADTDRFLSYLSSFDFKGVLIRSIEALAALNDVYDDNKNLDIIPDQNINILNHEAFMAVCSVSKYKIKEYFPSLELNVKERAQLIKAINNECDDIIHSALIYGRVPVMQSANCILRTADKCRNKAGFTYMTDRTGRTYPVYRQCNLCHNIIYNPDVFSGHGFYAELSRYGNLRADLTDEDPKECRKIAEYLFGLKDGQINPPPYTDHTTGHLKRGIL